MSKTKKKPKWVPDSEIDKMIPPNLVDEWRECLSECEDTSELRCAAANAFFKRNKIKLSVVEGREHESGDECEWILGE